jgi:hypothetical protein
MAAMENTKSDTQKVPGTIFKSCPTSKPNAKTIAIPIQKTL